MLQMEENMLKNQLERAKAMIVEGDFDAADKKLVQVLEHSTDTADTHFWAEAYFLKTLAEFRAKTLTAIDSADIKNSSNFAQALRFASEDEKTLWKKSLQKAESQTPVNVSTAPIPTPALEPQAQPDTKRLNRLGILCKATSLLRAIVVVALIFVAVEVSYYGDSGDVFLIVIDILISAGLAIYTGIVSNPYKHELQTIDNALLRNAWFSIIDIFYYAYLMGEMDSPLFLMFILLEVVTLIVAGLGALTIRAINKGENA